MDNISSQIKEFISELKFEEALELCNRTENKNNDVIQSQKVKILLQMFNVTKKQKLLNEALEVCERYVGNEIFDLQKNRIKNLLLKYFNVTSNVNVSSSV